MSLLKRIFTKKPKLSVLETPSSFQIVKDKLVIQTLRKDAIQSVQIAINDPSVGSGGLIFYLNADGNNGLEIPYYFKGTKAVETFIFGLPGVNRQSLVTLAESHDFALLDVWRRGKARE